MENLMSDKKEENAEHKQIDENETVNIMTIENEKESLFWNKEYLTLTQASRLTGIGISNLRKYVDSKDDLVLYIGAKRMIRRKKLLDELNHEVKI